MSDSKIQVTPGQPGEHPKAAAQRIGDELASARDSLSHHAETTSDRAQGHDKRARVKEELHNADVKSAELWEKTKKVVLQPGVAGGLLGIVNLALIGTVGYKLYTEPGLRSDRRFLTTAGVGAVVLFTGEGVLAESYRKSDAGKREEARLRAEGHDLYNQTKTIILRPGVLGGLAGVLNVGILGGLGYWSYQNWNTTWDQRAVTTTSVGLIVLAAVEGYLGEQYKEKELPKHK